MKENRNTQENLPVMHTWLPGPLDSDVRRSIDRIRRAEDVKHVAIMPDVHLAEGVCIGVVVATSNRICPQAVGADIGCGMATVVFDADRCVLESESSAYALLERLRTSIPVMRHPNRHAAPILPADLRDAARDRPSLASAVQRDGHIEFGTLGRGNHFLEFQSDEEGRLWLMVHCGSRAMGQQIARWHMRLATKAAGGLSYLDARESAGQQYLADVEWARRYADANRRHLLCRTAELMEKLFGVRTDWSSLFGSDHNHVQHEEHGGRLFWVHRKGANEASDGRPGIIPGSMGSWSYHVAGRGLPEALRSSSHGAGRRLSRHAARMQISGRKLLRELEHVWFDPGMIENLREESSSAYKDIKEVMRAQSDLVKVVRRLRPVLSYKGG